MVGADVLEVIAKAQSMAVRAIRLGRADQFIHGSRHWPVRTVILYLDPSPALTYRELRNVVLGMEFWVQQMPWLYPSVYDVFSASTVTKKAFLCLFSPD